MLTCTPTGLLRRVRQPRQRERVCPRVWKLWRLHHEDPERVGAL